MNNDPPKPQRYTLTLSITANSREQIADALEEAAARIVDGVHDLTSAHSNGTSASWGIEEQT